MCNKCKKTNLSTNKGERARIKQSQRNEVKGKKKVFWQTWISELKMLNSQKDGFSIDMAIILVTFHPWQGLLF